MKKTSGKQKSLLLSVERLRELRPSDLSLAVGGISGAGPCGENLSRCATSTGNCGNNSATAQ